MVVKALLILLLAFVVAAVVKDIVVKLLNQTSWAKKNKPEGQNGLYINKTVDLIGKLIQLVIFLLFVPGIFQSLGLTQVSDPILTLLNTIWGYVPNILAAALILWVGFYIAKLVREILVPVLNKIEVNRLQKIAGIEVSEQGRLSNTIAYIVYVLILIPVIIAALQVLNIRAISDPAIAALSTIFNYIPNILAALMIIIIGYILAKFIGNIVSRLIEASGLDAKLTRLAGLENSNFVLSEVIGKTVEAILIVFFVTESFSTLRLGVLTSIGVKIIAYMPAVLAALLIFAIAFLLANIAFSTLKKNGHTTAAVFCKYLIYVVAAFLMLNQLGIAKELVDGTFILLVGALAVAFAVSFGIGGRFFARNVLADFQKKINVEDAVSKLTDKD